MPHLGSGELVALVVGGATLLAPLVVWALLLAWSRAVRRRHAAESRWRFVWTLPAAGLVVYLLGCGGYAVMMATSFARVAHEAPERRSAVLAESISNAMNVGVVGACLGGVLLVAAVVALTIGQSTSLRASRA